MHLQDADRISYLKDAHETVKSIRAGGSLASEDEESEENIYLKAEDFLEDQIVKLPSGEWSFLKTE